MPYVVFKCPKKLRESDYSETSSISSESDKKKKKKKKKTQKKPADKLNDKKK